MTRAGDLVGAARHESLAQVRLQGLRPESYLTACIYHLVLKSQLLHKIFNLVMTIITQNIKLTDLWGS